MALITDYAQRYAAQSEEQFTIEEYLNICKNDQYAYASAAERILKAIGEPELIDTRHDPRLSRLFSNRVIKRYKPFEELYGMEDVIEQIVSYFKHSAQGLEESRQILYLVGAVGTAKSTIAEIIKSLTEKEPFYAIKGSPINDSPLSLFSGSKDKHALQEEYGIPARYLQIIPSPWLIKRISEAKGDLSKLTVVRRYPSQLQQIALSKVEPGDNNNTDISTLVGKLDIRKLEFFSQDDPDCYSYSGGLCLSNRGVLDYVEMFKAPIRTLHPLLTALQERNYKPVEGGGALPFDGVVLAHSNTTEYDSFRNDKKNEAFIDRMYTVHVPYNLRVDEEILIYDKLIRNSSLCQAHCAPGTTRMLAEFAVLSRLSVPENSDIWSKMKVYNGESLKDTDPHVKSLLEYKEEADHDEGMSGLSTRTAFKILSKVFNFDTTEIAANPVHLLYVLEQHIAGGAYDDNMETVYKSYVQDYLHDKYVEFIGKEIQTAYLESYSEYGQNLFDRYVVYADHWIQDTDYIDSDSGVRFDRGSLNTELEKIEKAAGISNPKDFRNEIVNFVLRARAKNGGRNPDWRSYEKLREVIEKRMFTNTEDLLPVISFSSKASREDSEKHKGFVERMVAKGYTEKQVRLLSEFYIRSRNSL